MGEGVEQSLLSFVIPPPVFGMGGVEVSPVVAVIPVVRSELLRSRWGGGVGRRGRFLRLGGGGGVTAYTVSK